MEQKGLIGAIFDFSFSEFVTTKVIKFLLGVAVVVNFIVTIMVIVSGFQNSALAGIVALILSPVIYLLLMLVSRIYLELIIVMFRIVEHVGAIQELITEKKAGAPAQD